MADLLHRHDHGLVDHPERDRAPAGRRSGGERDRPRDAAAATVRRWRAGRGRDSCAGPGESAGASSRTRQHQRAVRAGRPVVEAIGVHKWFRHDHVLDDVSLSVAEGEVVVIIGPSGSGKTTFLRCINHLERDRRRPAAGQRAPDRLPRERERASSPRRRRRRSRASAQEIGFVFQHFNLFPHLTAAENVALAPIRVRGIGRSKAMEEADPPARSGRASRTSATHTRASSPAVSSSASRSRARWR